MYFVSCLSLHHCIHLIVLTITKLIAATIVPNQAKSKESVIAPAKTGPIVEPKLNPLLSIP